MDETENTMNYTRIAEAIRFIRAHSKEQPCLETIAEAVNMSPFHFQRIFKEWVGIADAVVGRSSQELRLICLSCR